MSESTLLDSTFADTIMPPTRRVMVARDMEDGLAQWCQAKHITVEHQPLDFVNRPFLWDVYNDTAEHVALIKATQVGGSVWAILRCVRISLMMPHWRGWVYFFPTKTDVQDFSATRVKPLLEENDALRPFIGTVDRSGVRQLGEGYFYFRGMRTQIGVKSVPADGIAFDELDEATESMKKMARERLSGSIYKYMLELSNPSVPGYGIDLVYSGNQEAKRTGSDQRMWFVRCTACNTRSCLEEEFPTTIGEDDLRVLKPLDVEGADMFEAGTWTRCCPKCREPIDPRDGEWVQKYPHIKLPHGYRLSQLFSPTVDAAEIAKEYYQTRFPEHFYNLKIGVAWVHSSDKLSMAEVLACAKDSGMASHDDGPCTMGVDQGTYLHVVISRPTPLPRVRQIVHINAYRQTMPDDWKILDDLMGRFHIHKCVIDALPNQSLARAFALRHRGKVFLNTYDEKRRDRPLWREDDLTVHEDRTEAIDAARATFRVGTLGAHVLLPRQFTEVEEFARHQAALVKRRVEDDDGSVTFRYVRTAADHYAHAYVYDTLCWLYDMSAPKGVGAIRTPTITSVGPGRESPQGSPVVRIDNPYHPDYRGGRR